MAEEMSYIAYGVIKDGAIHFEKEEDFAMFLAANPNRKVAVSIDFETRQRTLPQNSALHVGCELLADALNLAGLEMKVVLNNRMNVLWSGDTVKELLYRPLMTAMFQKRSTTELTKDEVSEVWDTLFRELGEQHHVEYIKFPSKETKNG